MMDRWLPLVIWILPASRAARLGGPSSSDGVVGVGSVLVLGGLKDHRRLEGEGGETGVFKLANMGSWAWLGSGLGVRFMVL